jgi:uncharacterized membrane protein (UPF0127 family)
MVGLLGRAGLAANEALWIEDCRSIHTFFMRFEIDCVFVDQKGQIRKIYHHIKPWRMRGPVWSASAVIEMAAGQAKEKKLIEGDILACGP